MIFNKNYYKFSSTMKNSPLAGTLSEDSLSREQSPTARCAGVNGVENRCTSGKHVAVLIDSSLTLTEIHP